MRDRIGEDGEEANRRKKPQKSYRRDAENGGGWGGRRKNVDKCWFSRLRPRRPR